MTARDLERKLRRENSKIRFYPGPNRGSGLYIRYYDPNDPKKAGLKFLCGVPSPRWNGVLPKLNTIDENGKWVRGLKSLARLLAREKIAGKSLFNTGFIGKNVCPGFRLGSCGPTPRDQPHLVEQAKRKVDNLKRLRSMGGDISSVRQMEAPIQGVIQA